MTRPDNALQKRGIAFKFNKLRVVKTAVPRLAGCKAQVPMATETVGSRVCVLGEKVPPNFLLLHVLFDGVGIAAFGERHRRDALRVPHVGHVWAAFFQRTVFLLDSCV
jgi:hypothetical protein